MDSGKAKDDGRGGNNWSYKTCKVPVKSSPSTNTQFFTDRMVFLSPNQQRQCIEGTDVKIFLVVVLVIIFLLMASFHRSLLFRFLHFNAVGYSLP